jgi:hypothetical protein
MIVSDIILRVRRTFGDESAVQIQDADILRWINDGQIEIVKNNDQALQKTTLQNIVNGTSTYTLPADLLILRSLRYKLPDMLGFSALKFKNMQEFDDSIDGWDGAAYGNGYPIFFTVYEGKVVLFPTPNQDMASGLKILYNQQPVDVVLTTDTLALPKIYHNTIFKYCMWQASQLDEDMDPAKMYLAQFSDDLTILQNNEVQDPTDKYATITVLEYDQ